MGWPWYRVVKGTVGEYVWSGMYIVQGNLSASRGESEGGGGLSLGRTFPVLVFLILA